MTQAARLATAAWRLGSIPAARRFRAAVADPRAAQERVLEQAAARIAVTLRGRELGIDPDRHADVAAWRAEVPIATYEDHRRWIDRIAAGEQDVLTPGGVRCMEPTGGTSGIEKLVPITGELLAEFSRATTPWVHDLLVREPKLRAGRAYWAVSPPTRAGSPQTSGGIPIGLEHDSDYFPPLLARLADATLGLPRATSRVRELGASRHVTLLALLAMPDLAMVSVWSPSFFTLLAAELDVRWPLLLADLATGRIDASVDVGPDELRAELERAIGAHPRRARQLTQTFGDTAPRDLQRIWPQLALISCWTDAQASRALPGLRERAPNVRIQPKGLLATEGVTSIPWGERGSPVLAVDSHLIELLPEGADPSDGTCVRSPHQLEPGMRGEVLLTTAGGLTRYRTFDLVEVMGFATGTPTPTVRFLGRTDHASDLAGEKLTPDAAQEAIDRAGVEGFALIAPRVEGAPPGYVLVLDAEQHDTRSASDAAARLENALCELHHYALCRQLGQLGHLEPLRLAQPAQRWEAVSVQLGQRAGSRKDTALDPRPTVVPLLCEGVVG